MTRPSPVYRFGNDQSIACKAESDIFLIQFYYPLASAPDKLGVVSLISAVLTWCGEGALLALTVALFERWKAPTFDTGGV